MTKRRSKSKPAKLNVEDFLDMCWLLLAARDRIPADASDEECEAHMYAFAETTVRLHQLSQEAGLSFQDYMDEAHAASLVTHTQRH